MGLRPTWSVNAGTLWSAIGSSATFPAGAGFAAVATAGLLTVHPARSCEVEKWQIFSNKTFAGFKLQARRES